MQTHNSFAYIRGAEIEKFQGMTFKILIFYIIKTLLIFKFIILNFQMPTHVQNHYFKKYLSWFFRG